MIERIITGTATEADIEKAQNLSFDERKELIDQLFAALVETCHEATLYGSAMEDIGAALKQSRAIFGAGLGVDQALGILVNVIKESVGDLEAAGMTDSNEYAKQTLVLEKLEGYIAACEQTGRTEGAEAFDTVRFEYRGEMAELDKLSSKGEAGIANSLEFLQQAFGDSGEAEAFAKGLGRREAAAHFIHMFGSPSYIAFRHIAAPGVASDHESAPNDSEED